MIDTIKKIFEIIGDKKSEIYKAIVYNLFHSIFSAFDLFALLYIMTNVNTLTSEIIWKGSLILLIGIIGKFICKWRSSIKVSTTSYNVFRDKRLEIGERLKQAPMGYFNDQNLGSIQTAVTTGINELETNAVAVVENMIGSIIYAIVSTLVLCWFNLYIGLIMFVVLLINFLVLLWIQKCSDQFALKQVQSKEKLTTRVMEFVKGIMVMRIFTRADEDLERVNDAFKTKKEADTLVENTVTWPVNFYGFIFKLAGCGIIAAASIQCYRGNISLAFCIMFLLSAFLVSGQMSSMGGNIALLKVVRAALMHFDAVLDMPTMSGEKDLDNVDDYHIKVEGISFGYTNQEVINDVSMDVPFGKTIAIVGPSGSGKTTLCDLIGRFFDVNKGIISIGGIDVKELNPDAILAKMSFVFQNVYLFEDTIENNVKYGREQATHEEVIEACKKARCHDFIIAMKDGYQTVIGEGGATLSGGERQRISIARAMLKEAKIIILDEATSSVDPENEHSLVTALEELSKNRTLITIAHRLSTVSKADCIYVLDEGAVVQKGTHEKLLQQGGIYKNFVELRKNALQWKVSK